MPLLLLLLLLLLLRGLQRSSSRCAAPNPLSKMMAAQKGLQVCVCGGGLGGGGGVGGEN